MKLFIAITTILFLSACSQSQLSKKDIIYHIESHKLPSYLEVHSLNYESLQSSSADGRVSVSGLLKLKEPLYQEVTQESFPSDYIDKINLIEKLPWQSEFGYRIYGSVLRDELSKKTLLEQKYKAGLKIRFSGGLVFNETVGGDLVYKNSTSPLKYQPLIARVKEDFNDPVVDIDNFIDSTLLSLTTDEINCASRSEKKSIQKVLLLLKDSTDVETHIIEQFVTESGLPDLLIDVTQVGLLKGLRFESIVPGKKTSKLDKIKSREVSIKAEGKLEEITAFFEDYASLAHHLGINALTISRTDTGTYRVSLILYARLNDLGVTNTNIGIVPFSRCAELYEESSLNVDSLWKEVKKSRENYYLFDGFTRLFAELSGKIQLNNLRGSLRNPQMLRLTGKNYGAENIKYITEMIEGFTLKFHSIQAVGAQKEGRNDFSIDITLNEKED